MFVSAIKDARDGVKPPKKQKKKKKKRKRDYAQFSSPPESFKLAHPDTEYPS
jgi:hypothetical protein